MYLKRISSPDEYPPDTQYVLIVFSTTSIYVPSDQRAIETNGAHGYPGGTEYFKTPEIYAFPEKSALERKLRELLEQDRHRQDLLVLDIARMIPVKVSLALDI